MFEALKQFFKRRKYEIKDTEQAIKAWKSDLERIKDHPLTQAKIVNETLLNELQQQLKDINSKLDWVLEALKSHKSRPVIDNITTKDRELLNILYTPQTAVDVAKKLNITRSTASLRLNKLASMGLLEKESDGKNIKFKQKEEVK